MFIPLLGYQFKYKLYKIPESELIKILHQYGGYRDISNPNSLRKKRKGKNGFHIGGLGMFLANTIGKEMLKSAYPSYLALIFLAMACLFILISFIYENIQQGKIAPFTYNSVNFVTVKLADTVKHSVYKLTFCMGRTSYYNVSWSSGGYCQPKYYCRWWSSFLSVCYFIS